MCIHTHTFMYPYVFKHTHAHAHKQERGGIVLFPWFDVFVSDSYIFTIFLVHCFNRCHGSDDKLPHVVWDASPGDTHNIHICLLIPERELTEVMIAPHLIWWTNEILLGLVTGAWMRGYFPELTWFKSSCVTKKSTPTWVTTHKVAQLEPSAQPAGSWTDLKISSLSFGYVFHSLGDRPLS